MSLPVFDGDMNIIRRLDDEPNDVGGMSSDELKAAFDLAGERIKAYINGVLLPEITASNIPITEIELMGAEDVQEALVALWQAVQAGGGGGGAGIIYSVTQPVGQAGGGVWIQPSGTGNALGARFHIKAPDGYVELLFHTRAGQVDMPSGETLAAAAGRIMPDVPGDVQQYTLFPDTMTDGEKNAVTNDAVKAPIWNNSRIKKMEDDIAALRAYKPFITGVYTGTGTFGRTIDLGFAPSLVMVGMNGTFNWQSGRSASVYGGFATPEWNCGSSTATPFNDYTAIIIRNNGFVAYQYPSYGVQMNESGNVYSYVAWR